MGGKHFGQDKDFFDGRKTEASSSSSRGIHSYWGERLALFGRNLSPDIPAVATLFCKSEGRISFRTKQPDSSSATAWPFVVKSW